MPRDSVVVNGVTLTRAQIEKAVVELNTPAQVQLRDLTPGQKFRFQLKDNLTRQVVRIFASGYINPGNRVSYIVLETNEIYSAVESDPVVVVE